MTVEPGPDRPEPVPPPAPELERLEIVTGDRLATDLLRTALRTDDRLPTRTGLAICLRAALLAELGLLGAIEHVGHAPGVAGDPPAGDRILTAVHATVQRRPKVSWKRWYRHVDVDLKALTEELVDQGRWLPQGRRAYRDRDLDQALALGRRARAVGTGSAAAESPREAVLGLLAVTVGGAHGVPVNAREAPKIGALLRPFADVDVERLQAAHLAVATAGKALPRWRRRLR